MSEISELLNNRSGHATELPAEPALGLLVVTCMDARIDVHRLFGLKLGDAHVLRNAGGIVTDDVLRSVVLSQRLLGTREVMIIQHTGCGLHELNEDELKQQIQNETGVHIRSDLGGFSDIEAEIARSVQKIRSSPLVPHRDKVRGFVYDLESGDLREVQPD